MSFKNTHTVCVSVSPSFSTEGPIPPHARTMTNRQQRALRLLLELPLAEE